jgi:hypothetical protein
VPTTIDLAPLAAAGRSDRNREVAGEAAVILVAVLAGIDATRIPTSHWIEATLLAGAFAVAVLGVYLLARAVVPRPKSVELSNQGMRLFYPSGNLQSFTWPEAAAALEVLEVTAGPTPPGIDASSGIQLSSPVPHFFRVADPALDSIRAAARGAGLTEEVLPLRRATFRGWATIGVRVRFGTGPSPLHS